MCRKFQIVFTILKSVDYKAIKSSQEFQAYVKHTAELRRVQLENMSRAEALSFFINVYNALVIHANVVNGPPVSLWQRYKVSAVMLFSMFCSRSTTVISAPTMLDTFHPGAKVSTLVSNPQHR